VTGPLSPLEREYSPSTRVASLDAEIERYRRTADEAAQRPLERVESTGLAGGSALVVGPATGGHLHVFIHGGYWQELRARDSIGPALGFASSQVSFAAVDYTLAPAATIPAMIRQCTDVVDALLRRYEPTSVTLSGHSAGAHLAAHVALARPAQFDLVVLVSGVYDLEPLVDTYINVALAMTSATARAWSVPVGSTPDSPVVVAHGEHETDAFIDQSAALAEAWAAPREVLRGRNHFDAIFDLAALDVPSRTAAPQQRL
jgi:arylformamidase